MRTTIFCLAGFLAAGSAGAAAQPAGGAASGPVAGFGATRIDTAQVNAPLPQGSAYGVAGSSTAAPSVPAEVLRMLSQLPTRP